MSGRRFRSDDTERIQWQNPVEVLTEIGLGTGMVFVDAGCGEGFFSIPAARIVGPTGKVYCYDINEAAIGILKEQAASEGLLNVIAEKKPAEDAVMCKNCADFVFFGIDLHDFSDPSQVIRNARTMLKKTGKLVDLDWKDEEMPMGPPLSKRFSIPKAMGLIESSGFRVLSIQDHGLYHYLIMAQPE